MLNSFSSCISNASEEFSWTPKVSMSEVIPQPGMFLHQLESRIPLEQLQCPADRHCWWQFNKKMDMVNCDMKFVNFTSIFEGNLSDKPLTINFQPIKLEWVHGVFNFPDKMESILSEGMLKTLQIHFFAPQTFIRSKVLTMFVNLVHGDRVNPHLTNTSQELNLVEEGNSSLGLKAEVSLPLM